MAAKDTVDTQSRPELDSCGKKRVVVYEILHARNGWKTSGCLPWEVCIGLVRVLEMSACVRPLDFFGTSAGFLADVLDAIRHESEVEMLMMIQLYAPSLRGVS